jgi:hypothetical protein
MENTERKEALAAIDIVAAEIHAEYAKVGEQTGHKLPSWEDVPEAAKAMPRTLARLMLSKMEKVYLETYEKMSKAAATATPAPPAAAPAKESLGDKAKLLEGITKGVEEAVARLIDKQAVAKEGNPFAQGVDAAIKKITEKLAIDVLVADQELQDRIKEQVTKMLETGLFGDEDHKDSDERGN